VVAAQLEWALRRIHQRTVRETYAVSTGAQIFLGWRFRRTRERRGGGKVDDGQTSFPYRFAGADPLPVVRRRGLGIFRVGGAQHAGAHLFG